MTTDTLISLVSLLVILSIAAERLVEIVKGPFAWLNETERPSDGAVREAILEWQRRENYRKTALHVLSIGAGIVTALLSLEVLSSYFPEDINKSLLVIGMGVLASGGSGFWNSVLGYLNEVKKIKKRERETT